MRKNSNESILSKEKSIISRRFLMIKMAKEVIFKGNQLIVNKNKESLALNKQNKTRKKHSTILSIILKTGGQQEKIFQIIDSKLVIKSKKVNLIAC